MYRISAIIEDAFREFLPLAEKRRIGFDIDFPDPTIRISRPSIVRTPLFKQLPLAIERAQKHVSFAVKKSEIIIRDDGIALTPAATKELSSNENVTVKSRVGFGTEVRIKFA